MDAMKSFITVNCLIGLYLDQMVVTRRSWLPIVERGHVCDTIRMATAYQSSECPLSFIDRSAVA